jgi:hypothetical protein
MSEPRVDVEEGGAVVRFTHEGKVVVVDARAHDLLVSVVGGRSLRVAASRAGFADAVQSVDEICASKMSVEKIEEYVRGALFAAARARGVDVEPAYRAVAEIDATVLPCCRGIVENPYLLADVARFRAAATAVAFLEETTLRDRTAPEQTDAWAYRLRDWRSLFVAPGSIARSVNRTLAQFGDEVAPELLWGLRRVKLTAPLSSVQHVEVLGGLGTLGDEVTRSPLISAALQEVVLRASAQQLGEALVLVDEADPLFFGTEIAAQRLAEVLTSVPLAQLREDLDRRVSFSDLLERALNDLREVLKIDTETIAPPIPLPSSPGIRFLNTVGAILCEGVEMDHCVATRAPRALAGDSYLFHIDHEGQRATAEVGRSGAVLEVRGPHNTRNIAVAYAQAALRTWGARLGMHTMGDPSTSLWTTPAPPLPPGYEPVTTLAALGSALAALTTPPEDGDDSVWVWAARCAEEAVAGRRWLVALRAAGVTLTLSSLDDKGAVMGNAIAVREGARALGMVDDNDDDDDVDWEAGT